jgi:predicted unusual protein kinase regulating ubiquinone biosynthesis (AarF/ABC1/UbiB family)
MMEETDYALELKRSVELSTQCSHLNNIVFPNYYAQYSSPRILAMDWLEGKPLGEFTGKVLPDGVGDKLGQAMWDFYHFQMHKIRSVHADPHPGNFIITPDHQLGVIDFGCVKEIPESFYNVYFRLMDEDLLTNNKKRDEVFYKLRFIYPDDTAKDKVFFTALFSRLVALLAKPFRTETFDFADNAYFEALYAFGEELTSMKELRNSKKPRGQRDAIYINRTYFGLYNILHDLKANIKTVY